jgi:hypothetical protein
MRIRLLAAATAAAVASLAFFPAGAQANHRWGNYHWARTSNPFTLQLLDVVNANWDSYVRVASSDWTASSVLNTTVVAGSGSASSCSGVSGRVKVCNASYGSTGWLGVASISVNGSHITAGTVRLNDTYFNTATYNTPQYRQFVACQEIGHTFGLDHQDENFNNANLNTCMDYTRSPASNQHPNQHDYDMLVTIYSHLDSTSTVASASASATQVMSAKAPASWGSQVEGSRGHGASTYVRNLGQGQMVITHVLWA